MPSAPNTPASHAITLATDVIRTEADGLARLSDIIADEATDLSKALGETIGLLLALKGRVIVTGMGKSGHVARKIASTLASTGTPASFVHPAEASHGDLGMISNDDVIIALSNSGETAELGDIITYAGRFNIPLVAMTSGADSTLAKASDILLLTPPLAEACSVTRAPTTSCIVMMALGDAVAVSVLQSKGFTAEDFHIFHPGGKLGASLKRVSDLMHHTDMPLCSADTSVTLAVEKITQAGFGCVGVIDAGGHLEGIVTDGDLRRHFGEALDEVTVGSIMTRQPLTVAYDSLAAEALSLLNTRKITALFIVDDVNRPLGLLHVHDCLAQGIL